MYPRNEENQSIYLLLLIRKYFNIKNTYELLMLLMLKRTLNMVCSHCDLKDFISLLSWLLFT